MKRLSATSVVVVLGLLLAVSGCGGGRQSAFAPAGREALKSASSGYSVIHSFSGTDGAQPLARLVRLGGTLYGTTSGGGTHGSGYGVVFEIATNGTERVLHSFGAKNDGQFPAAALLVQRGMLYGTTNIGGSIGTGTVFSITTGGQERVLLSFGEFDPSPSEPYASLIWTPRSLYGTTTTGGAHGGGTVFAVDLKGNEKIVHSFGSDASHDGQLPTASLILSNGTVYGTTLQGGRYRKPSCQPAPCPGYGTAFSIDATGKETVLHDFGSGADGANPGAGLTLVNGTFYGTTQFGGRFGYGTVFSMTPSGTVTILHNFGGSGDGAVVMSGLTYVNSVLYGTTEGGGAYKTHGTVFRIALDGSNEQVVHSFGGGTDGSDPEAGVTALGGMLYGTTRHGGSSSDGTVFALTP